MAKRMIFDVPHQLTLDAARERIRALGDYFHNRHGIHVGWNDETTAWLKGRYLMVNFDATVEIRDHGVHVEGKDPGMLLRKKAQGYLEKKVRSYLDPATPLESLARA